MPNPWGELFQLRNRIGGGYIPPKPKMNFNFDAFIPETTVPQEGIGEDAIPRELGPDYAALMSGFRNIEEGPASKAYGDYLNQAPTPEKVGWGRRILAGATGGLAGLNQGAQVGMRAADEVLTQPYRTQIQQWEAKEPGMRYRATQEESRAGKAQQMYKNLMDWMDKDQQLQIQMKNARTAEERNTITKEHYKALEERARINGMKVTQPDGQGNVYQYDPADPSRKTLLYNDQLAVRGVRARERSAGAAETSAAASMITAKSRTPAGEIPTQQRTDTFLRAQKLLNRFPSLKKYVVIDATSNSVSFSDKIEDLDPTEREFIYNSIHGKGDTDLDTGEVTNRDLEPPPEPKYQKNVVTGEMRVSYDGGKTWQKVQ